MVAKANTALTGTYTLQQKVNLRYLDAHTSSGNDYSVVTRAAQGDDSQKWVITHIANGLHTMQQKLNVECHGGDHGC